MVDVLQWSRCEYKGEITLSNSNEEKAGLSYVTINGKKSELQLVLLHRSQKDETPLLSSMNSLWLITVNLVIKLMLLPWEKIYLEKQEHGM